MADHEHIGMRVRSLRQRKGWTLEQLAQEAQASKGYLSTVESGKSQPSGRVLLRLAQALGASVDFLVQGEGAAPPAEVAPVTIPRELAEAAERENWSFRKVRAVLEARGAIIARRSDHHPRPFTGAEWLAFAARLEPYLEPEDD